VHSIEFGKGVIKFNFDLNFMRLEWQFIAERFFLLIGNIENELFGERMLMVQVLVHDRVLINEQVAALYIIFYHVFRRRQHDMDKGDCICLFNLNR